MTIPSVGGADQPYCSFYVGQKVVCVCVHDDNVPHSRVTVGQVYTVREVFIGRGRIGLQPTLRLVGIIGAKNGVGREKGFLAAYFRPATDISVFEAMLKRAPVDGTRRLRELEREGV